MPINFEPKTDSERLHLYQTTREISAAYKTEYEADWALMYQLYHCFVDMSNRDPERNNPFMPETFVALESSVPQHVKALFGTQPMFPIKPNNPLRKDYAKAYEKLLDYFVAGAWDRTTPFLSPAEKLIKIKKLFGCVAHEDFWDYSYHNVEVKEPVVEKSIPIGTNTKTDKVLRGRWNMRVYPPWMLGVDPSTECIEQMAWFIPEEPMRKSALIEHMKQFPKQYKAKWQDIEKSQGTTEFTLKLRQQMGFKENDADDDMGVRARLYLPTRNKMIEVWNGNTILRVVDTKPRFVRWIAIDDPYPNCFYAHTPVKPAAMLQMIENAIVANYLDALDRTTDPVMGYETGAIDPDQIVSGLVAVNPERLQQGRSISDILQRIDTGQVDPNLKDAIELVSNTHKQVYAQSDYTQGNIPTIRKESATAVRAVKDSGQARIDHEASRDERTGKTKMFIHAVELIDLHMDDEEIEQVVGDGYQYIAEYRNINTLPGGYTLDYKGADDIAEKDAKFERRLIKYEKLKDQIPNPQAIAKDLLKNDDDFSSEVIEEAFTPQAPPQQQIDPLTGQPIQQQGQPGAQGAAPAPPMQPNSQVQPGGVAA